MRSILKSALFVLLVILLVIIVFPAAAQFDPIASKECGTLGLFCSDKQGANDFVTLLWRAINTFLVLVSIVAAIFIMIGGIRYITAGSNESGQEKAKNTILYAVIGLLVIGVAAALVNFTLLAIR